MLPTRTYFLFGIFALLAGNASQADEKAKQRTDQPMPRVIEYKWMTLDKWRWFHQGDLDRAKSGPVDVLFLGDSITECWDTRGLGVWEKEFAPLRAANFGVGGDTTQNVLWRITKGGALEGIDPKVIVLMIGTNNIGLHNDSPEAVAAGVMAILNVVHHRFPQAKILLHAIFPRGQNSSDSHRKKVVQTNEQLKRFSSLENLTWFPLWDEFLERDGDLPKSIMPDYLHPNEKGYKIWAKAILPEVRRMLKSYPN